MRDTTTWLIAMTTLVAVAMAAYRAGLRPLAPMLIPRPLAREHAPRRPAR